MKSTDASMLIATTRHAGANCPACGTDIDLGDRIALCGRCGGVHHQKCWDRDGECQSYACAPSRRESLAEQPAVVITSRDLAQATPLPRGVRTMPGWTPVEPPAPPRLSKLAITSFVLGLLGIPLFGLATGLIAILVGLIAVSGTHGSRVRGGGFAIAGITLGAVSFVGWLVAVVLLFDTWNVPLRPVAHFDFRPDPKALEGMDPTLSRSMRANVLIERRMGLGYSVGSGVIMRKDGAEAVIVTNWHVVEPAIGGRTLEAANDGRLFVTMMGQEATAARVAWIAPHDIDLAIVRVPFHSPDAEAARWRRGRQAHVGDRVFAIGNPHELGWTHTEGTLSQFRVSGNGPGEVKVIQTQTALNSGNSGGGLYTRDGWLIGINTWVHDQRVSEGLGFAIELDSVLALSPPGLGAEAVNVELP